MINCGVFTISIDLELAWGVVDRLIHSRARSAIQLERDIVQRLLAYFTNFNVSATWAVVGHLLLTECNWEDGIIHPEIIRPVARGYDRDWFFQHPKHYDPLWYGLDIVDWIRNASPKQEIGSHSFAHIIYDEKNTNENAVRSDIERAKQLHQTADLPFEAFVFPRNIVGFFDLLARAGIRVYRGHTKRWFDIPPRSFRRLLMLFNYIFAITPPTVMPMLDDYGMVNIPDSMLLFSRNGPRSLVSPKSITGMGITGLNQAAKKREIFHLYFHPSNFTYKTEIQFQILEAILRHAQTLREQGVLEILTLLEIDKRIRGAN